MATEAPKQPPTLEQILDALKARGQADQPLRLAITTKIKPGTENEFKEAIRKVVPITFKQEEGCTTYEFSQDFEDPTTFVIYEEWKNVAALEFHLEQSYTNDFLSVAYKVALSYDRHAAIPIKTE